MKVNISKGTKNLIYCLLGLVIILAVFFFGFQNIRQENNELKGQKAELEEEIKQLNEIQVNQSEYESQIEEYESRRKGYYKEFPALVQARDQILYAAELENRYDSMLISEMEMEEAEHVMGTDGDALALYKIPAKMECNINYDQLKDFLMGTTKDGTRKVVDEIVLTKDSVTGNLTGTISISMYYMTGTGQKYEAEQIEDVTVGTPNIFQNGVTSVPQEEEVPQTQEETE